MTSIRETLESFERAELQTVDTPIEHLARLSNQLGIDLWIKRDDLTSLGLGGNKIRQLEYYFGAALAQGADTVLITGAVQSNYVRATAAAAAKLGLKTIIQLENRVPNKSANYSKSGNVLLGQLLGAEYMYYPEGEDEAGADKALRARADELRAQGRNPYVIPLGLDNKPLGALGYVRAADEILEQGPEFDAIVVASGSGQTHAGLLTGLRAFGSKTPVFGICVRRDAVQQAARLQSLTARLADMLGAPEIERPEDINVYDGALAPGYGQVGDDVRSAINIMAQNQGLFLDPVYTGKTFAGLLGLLKDGTIRPDSRILFIHTGGQPALFAYQEDLSAG